MWSEERLQTETRQTGQLGQLDQEDTDRNVRPAAAEPDLQSQSCGTRQEVRSGCGHSRSECKHQRRQRRHRDCPHQRTHDILIHSLSVECYRDVYNSVLQPSVLTALSSSQHPDYVSQVLELKQCLWTKLSRPRLQETLMEDGRVEVKETFDLT